MTSPFAPRPDDLLDREQIRECIYRYARAIDRCDEELLRSTYWPDARANQLEFSGSREEFIAWSLPALRSMRSANHHVGNILIAMDGDNASSESYFQGLHIYVVDGTAMENLMGGRYVDRHQKRDGEWRILERTVVVDWFRDFPDATNWAAGGPFGMKAVKGEKRPGDLTYEVLGNFRDR